MRPDPWQQKKSRQYQSKRRAKGLEVKNEKKTDQVQAEKSVGGFKFVAPQPVPVTEDSAFDSDEYDVCEAESVDFDSLKIASPVFDDSIRLPVLFPFKFGIHI